MDSTATAPARLIVYACPTGPLAEQVAAFYAESRARFGPNRAHAFPPHITLTGFFHDDLAALPVYLAALAAAHEAALARRPASPVTITELAASAVFQGLLITSPWLEALTADFASRAASPSRRDALRLKTDLHLSLAYGFRPDDAQGLAAMARAMVDITSAVDWELRFYQQLPGDAWHAHGAWEL